MRKIIFLTILMTVFLTSDAYAQGVISRPTKSNNTQTIPSKSNKPARTQPSKSNSPTMKQEEVWVPSTQVSAPDDYINGHGYVDLGLPSGRKWATCNVGASASQDYGDYFAWGETTIKRNYSWPNSITYEKDYSFLQQSGIIDNSEDLTTKHDAAQVNWGDNWQIPSYSDFKELIDECHWEKTSINGKNGFKVIGPNNKSIFFPATGRMKYSHKYFEGLDCEYWSRTIDNEHPKYATAFWIREHDNEPFPIWCDRYEGRTIRPVVK